MKLIHRFPNTKLVTQSQMRIFNSNGEPTARLYPGKWRVHFAPEQAQEIITLLKDKEFLSEAERYEEELANIGHVTAVCSFVLYNPEGLKRIAESREYKADYLEISQFTLKDKRTEEIKTGICFKACGKLSDLTSQSMKQTKRELSGFTKYGKK
jgi:hypothetical protein